MATQETQKIFGVDVGFKVEAKLTRWVGILIGEAIVIIIVTWLILVPRFQAIMAAQAELASNQTLLRNLQTKLSLIDDFGVEFAGNDEVMTSTFMTSKDPGLMLSAIKQVSDLSGVSIVSYSISPSKLVGTTPAAGSPAAKKGLDFIEISLSVSGQPSNVSQYLKLLDESLPMKKVSSLEVAQGSLQSGILQLKLKVQTFVYPTKVQAVTLGLIQPFSDESRTLFSQLSGYTRSQSGTGNVATSSAQLGNPNLFGL